MVSTEILATASEIKAKAEQLRSYNEQFKARQGDLLTRETSLCGMWEGQAKETFDKAFKSDTEQMTNFYNLMTQYIQTLEQIATEYEKAESINYNTAATRTY